MCTGTMTRLVLVETIVTSLPEIVWISVTGHKDVEVVYTRLSEVVVPPGSVVLI